MSKPNQPDEPALDPVEKGLLLLVLSALFSCWPALVWHGRGGPTGNDWRWDTHSTVACSIWWGFMLVVGVIVVVGKRLPEISDQERDYSYPNPQKDD